MNNAEIALSIAFLLVLAFCLGIVVTCVLHWAERKEGDR